MSSFNSVILMGNLTRDPEVRYTSSGTAVARFGLAINRKWRSESGEDKEEVTFVDVDAFGKQAEVIGQHLGKGRKVLVEGRLKTDSWEDKQSGQKRSKLGVVMEKFYFIDSASGGEKIERPARTQRETQPEQPDLPEDDDVPF